MSILQHTGAPAQFAMEKLRESCIKHGPLCIGLDTDPSYLPPEVLRLYAHPSDAVLAYNKGIIEATGENAGCYKVQIAYYEAQGIKGLSAYAETLRMVRNAGHPVIADIKRGDIADTAKAYARAHFSGEFEADIITLNPYMGFDTLEPFLEYVKTHKKGAFVLLRTSNPGMKDIEQQVLQSGNRVLDAVGSELSRIASVFAQDSHQGISPVGALQGCPAGISPVGAVVGCTEESDARLLRDSYPNIFFLIPGYGAQGGAARIASTLLEKAGGTVNSSRAILTAWKKTAALEFKRSASNLTMNDIVQAAAQEAFASKTELTKT